MPRGTAVSERDADEWLEMYRNGTPIDAIALRAGRTQRTVKAYVEVARQRRESAEVRRALIQDAYRQHFADLFAFADQLRTQMTGGTARSANLSSRQGALLRNALKDHLPKSQLWNHLRDHAEAVTRCALVQPQLREDCGKQLAAMPENLSRNVDGQGWLDSLAYAAGMLAAGEQLSAMEYRVEVAPTGGRLRWGNYGLSVPSANDVVAEVQAAHQAAVASLPFEHNFRRLAEAMKAKRAAVSGILDEVDALLLRRFLPGRCTLCP